MKDLNINDYLKDLEGVCTSCKNEKCKDRSVICMRKKLVFNIAKVVYKQRKKKGQI